MKPIFIAIIILCLFTIGNAQPSSSAQRSSDDEREKLASAVTKEDWKEVAILSKQYLEKLQAEDSEGTLARLRFVFLFSSAGRVTLGEMTYNQLQSEVNPMVGQEVQLPFGKIVTECRGNPGAICFPAKSNFDVSVALLNSKGTYIHAFVYANLREKFDPSGHIGEFASLRGVVDSIELNPNQSTIWIMRVFLKNGLIVTNK